MMTKIKTLKTAQDEASEMAREKIAEASDYASENALSGVVIMMIDRGGQIKVKSTFERRLEFIGAIEAAKSHLWDTE